MTASIEKDDDGSESSSRVAYIWSQHLQDVCDDLPSNVGRSGTVHGLIRALQLLDIDEHDDTCMVDDVDEDATGHAEYLSGTRAQSEPGIETPVTNVHGAETTESARTQRDSDDDGEQIVPDLQSTSYIAHNTQILSADHARSQQGASLPRRKARVFTPDLSLGNKACLLRYHDAAYVEYLLKDRSKEFDEEGEYTPSSEPENGESSGSGEEYTSSSSSSSSSSSHRPRKRRRRTPPPSQRFHGLTHDNPPFPTLSQYTQLVAAGTSTACRLLAKGEVDCAIVWDGGRHHAKRAEASGFCYVADIVLGCMLLAREGRVTYEVERLSHISEKEGGKTESKEEASDPTTDGALADDSGKPNGNASSNGDPGQPRKHIPARPRSRPPRILYLDMDLHYGDGVALAFHSPTHYSHPLPEKIPRPPSVLTFSVHHSSPIFFPPPLTSGLSDLPNPETPHPFTLSLPLAAYPSARTYKKVFKGCIEPVMKAWNPDYVVLQLGVDGLSGDRVGQYGNWQTHGEGSITWIVEEVKKRSKKLCVLGGGGYNHPNAARAWAGATSVLLDYPLDEDTPIPHHDQFEVYAPSFTLDVQAGHIKDENTSKDIDRAIDEFHTIARRIEQIVAAHS